MDDIVIRLNGVVYTFYENKPAVVLQRRSPTDFTGKPQKYAGSYQFTVSGQVGGILEHLFRYGAQQLGEEFVSQLKKFLLLGFHDVHTGPDLYVIKHEEGMDIYVEIFLPPYLFGDFQNLLFLSEKDIGLVQPLTLADELGVPGDAIKMFPWDIEELKRIFKEGKLVRALENYRQALQEP